MTETERFLAHADAFTRVVDDTDAAGAWDSPSACADWSAADLLAHVVETQRAFLTEQGLDPGDTGESAPPARWRTHLGGVRPLLEEPRVHEAYDGYFGPTTVADTLADFYGFDLIVHRWDLGRAAGVDVTWTEDEMAAIEASLDVFGEAFYSEGIGKPALDPPDGADRQTRLLARMGRRA